MNILLVDDDQMIRSWLTIMLWQADIPEENLFVAENGKNALEICASSNIDLVITDLEMPTLDGFQLLSELHAKFPLIRAAVLTSYPDYEYVRAALKFQVIDYIVKPLMTLEDILTLLDRYHHTKYDSDFNLPDPQSSLQHLNEYLVSDSHTFQIRSVSFSENQPVCCYCIQFQAPDTLQMEADIKRFLTVCEECFHTEKISGSTYLLSPALTLLLCQGECNKELSPSQYYERLIRLLEHKLSKYTHLTPSFHSFRECASPSALKKHISYILSLNEAQAYYQDPVLTSFSTLNASRIETACLKIQSILLHPNNEPSFSCLKWVQTVHKKRVEPEQIRKALRLIISSLLPELRIHAFHLGKEALQAAEESLESLEFTRDFQNTEAIISHLEECLIFATTHKQCKVPFSIQSCIEYIENHYAAPIQLEDAAKHVHLNSAYLSFLFKKHTGISFVRFLEYVRIRQAKHLLQTTQLSIAEISETVGFSGQNYFSKVFRRVVGCNPSSYRSRLIPQ